MREIGGFQEIELNTGKKYHEEALAFNSGAKALYFLLKNSAYQTVYMPYFTCNAVHEIIKQVELEVIFYKIDNEFKPKVDFKIFNKETVLIYNNYFGINEALINEISKKTRHLIVDSAQAFYFRPKLGQYCFNSVRKFFGVPDGGFLYGFTSDSIENYLQLKEVKYNYSHLINRLEFGTEKSYE
jgi:hypothetical protein